MVAGRASANPYSAGLPMTATEHAIVRRLTCCYAVSWASSRSASDERGEVRGGSAAGAEAWQKLHAERVRIEKRRKQAAILEDVAMLDETLLLSSTQRQELCKLLAGKPAMPWQPINSIVILNPQVQQLFAMLSRGGVYGLFCARSRTDKEIDRHAIGRIQRVAAAATAGSRLRAEAVPKPGRRGCARRRWGGRAARGSTGGGGQCLAVCRASRKSQASGASGPTLEDQERQLAASCRTAAGRY